MGGAHTGAGLISRYVIGRFSNQGKGGLGGAWGGRDAGGILASSRAFQSR